MEAEAAKGRGNEHYKRREFAEALACYDQALQLVPTNMVRSPARFFKNPSMLTLLVSTSRARTQAYMSNKAAVYLEQGDSQRCIDECK